MNARTLAALVLAAATPGLPARAAAAEVAPSAEARLREIGWEPASGDAPTGEMYLDVPRVALGEAIRTLQLRPEGFPRPVANATGRFVTLPVPARAEYTHRVEEPQPALTWTIDALVVDTGAGFTWTDIDVPPLAARRAESKGTKPPFAVEGVAGDRPFDLSMRPLDGWRQDPARRRGPGRGLATSDGRAVPTLVVEPATEMDADGLFVTADDGRTWFRLALSAESRKLRGWTLDGWTLRGSASGGRRVLFAMPRVRQAKARLELLAMDASGTVSDLGTPEIPAAAWQQEITDARLLPDGAAEAIVIVRDPLPRSEDTAAPWGAVRRRDASGTWRDVKRFALPEDGAGMDVRFDDGDLVLVGDAVIARQPIGS